MKSQKKQQYSFPFSFLKNDIRLDLDNPQNKQVKYYQSDENNRYKLKNTVHRLFHMVIINFSDTYQKVLFPKQTYSSQNRSKVDAYCSLPHLNSISLFLLRIRLLSTYALLSNQSHSTQQLEMQDLSLALRNVSTSLINFSQVVQGAMCRKKGQQSNYSPKQQSCPPQYQAPKKLGIKRNMQKFCTGGWSAHENQLYLKFLMENRRDFTGESTRRRSKVFSKLSKVLKKRTPNQCRSHHQKLQMKYDDDFNRIMEEVYRRIQRTIAQDLLNQYHRLHRPDFDCFGNQKKPNLKQNSKVSPSTGIQSNSNVRKWYKMKNRKGCIRLEIKTQYIQQWAPK